MQTNRSAHKIQIPSRREFLARSSALGAAAVTIGGALPLARAAHTGADDVLKLALVGCGNRGSGAVAQALSTSGAVKLWAMADAFPDRMKTSLATLSSVPSVKGQIDVSEERQFIGLDAYRKAIDSGVDVVLIAGPPGYRPLHFEYAIKAGKHAFIEKPVATDAPGVKRILAAAEEAKRKGLKVGVGLQRHHDAIYVDMINRLQQGEIGDITFYRCYWDTAQPAKQPISHKGLTELEYQVRNWYFFSWLSGDHIVEQHIHNIDVCNWVQNAVPVSAQGVGGRQVRTGKEYGDIYDHHAVEYTYANGAKMFSQCRQIPGCYNQVAEYAHGTRGWCDVRGIIHPTNGPEIKLRTLSRRGNKPGDHTNPFQREHDDLFNAIRTGKDYNEAERGAQATMTAILGRMATYSGKLVTWEEALSSQLQLTTDAEDWNAAAPVKADADGRYPVAVPGISKAV